MYLNPSEGLPQDEINTVPLREVAAWQRVSRSGPRRVPRAWWSGLRRKAGRALLLGWGICWSWLIPVGREIKKAPPFGRLILLLLALTGVAGVVL